MSTGRRPKVVVVGGTYVDMAIRCGEIPSAGQAVAGSALAYSASGPGPNQAVEAALCGCDVHLVSMIGGDPFGHVALRALEEYEVSTEFVRTAPAKNTGVVVTLVDCEGENGACHYLGANASLQSEDIESAEQVISEADVCLIHGKLPQDAIVRAITCAKVHGTHVVLNPARPFASSCAGGGQCSEAPTEYFSADVVVPNLYEAAEITDTSPMGVRAAKLMGSDLVARGVKYAVITMGRHGCMVVDRNGANQIPAFAVELVDGAGRGDAFAGALAASCAVGDDVRTAVEFASAAGALACTKFGAMEAMSSKADIIQLLQRADIDRLPMGD